MDPHRSRLVDFTRSHAGVITWGEAMALDIPPDRIQSWQRSGRLRRVAPQVYAIAGIPETWEQRVRIATASGAAWASHRTAAARAELNGFDRRVVEVITHRGRRRKRQAWKVHESRTLRGADLTVVDGVPLTTIVRTILDLPLVAHPFLVGKALDDACRRGPGMLEAIVRRHQQLPRRGRRGVALMDRMLEERLGEPVGTNDFETMAIRLVRAIGLPDPVPQHPVRDGDFVAYLDLAWPEIRWFVECDSLAFHSDKAAHEWDRARRRRLKRLGWDRVEVTYDDVTRWPDVCARDLRELYYDRAERCTADHADADHVRQSGDLVGSGVAHQH